MVSRVNPDIQSVNQVIAKQEGFAVDDTTRLLSDAADIGKEIIKSSQEAKINENFAKAQLETNALAQQFQTEYESNPFEGVEKFKAERQKVFDKYGSEISPFFRRAWDTSARDFGFKDDAQNQAWAFKQSQKNTITSINESIQTNLNMAVSNGQRYATSDANELGSFLDFATGYKKLEEFGNKSLGAESTKELLKSYGDDYIKSFVSGVADNNPVRALQLMENPMVKDGFKNIGDYENMKEAVGNRALNVKTIMAKKEVLNVLKDEHSILAQSLERPMGYAELQQALSKSKISDSAKAFFMSANGYSKSSGGSGSSDNGEGGRANSTKLDDAQKVEVKTQLLADILQTTLNPNSTPDEVAKLQNRVFEALNNKALTKEEGVKYINQIVSPVVARQEEYLKNFGEDEWGWGADDGFETVKKTFDDEFAVKPDVKANGEDKDLPALVENANNKNRLSYYNFYLEALQKQASAKNIDVGQIPTLKRATDRVAIYNTAASEAKANYLKSRFPELAEQKDIPNAILDGNVLISGMAGTRNLTLQKSVNGIYSIKKDSETGVFYKVYSDGTKEEIQVKGLIK